MTNPQKENGYTAIANEILEQIARVKLSPTQYRIIFIIWRYTYGFNRKEHNLSLGFLSKATGCDKRQIQRELKNLEEMKVIKQNVTNGKSRIIKFNKHYDTWVVKTDIGEITIGEIDNGETVKGAIGETVKGAIGEIDNQERHILNTNLKKDIIYLSEEEAQLIKILEGVSNYPLDREKEIEMLKRLSDKYSTLDIISVVKDWAIGKIDKPLKKKDNPRSQINTWCKNADAWGKNKKEDKHGTDKQPNGQSKPHFKLDKSFYATSNS